MLGAPACVELLAVLELPETERATLIGQLYEGERGQVLAEVLADVKSDPDDLTRLRLIGALGGGAGLAALMAVGGVQRDRFECMGR